MRRADRLFEIIQYLRTRKVTTADWLADKLEVSVRTIYRDIQDLMTSGLPIEGEAGIGYVLRRGFDLPPLMFSEEEITALVLGARLVQSRADSKLAHAADLLLRKVETVLPEQLRERLNDIHLYSPISSLSSETADMLGELRDAISQRAKARFTYTRADGLQTQRTVWPLGLFYWDGVWTLGAWCELRQDLRSFRPDRMRDLQLLSDRFSPEPGKSIEDLIGRLKAGSDK